MGLTKEQSGNVEQVLKVTLRNKFKNYSPEPASMPFYTKLLGKDRLALYSFIQSLITNFGEAVFEPVAVSLASPNFKQAKSHVKSGDTIYEGALLQIQQIMDNLMTASESPDKIKEIKTIRAVCQTGLPRKVKPTLVDLFLETYDNKIFLSDIKTAKPNAGGFKELKRTMLEWIATTLAINPEVDVSAFISIPYNPYEPKPYNRWTIRGMLDLPNELKVGAEFWDFLGGDGAYKDILDCFEHVGIALRDEIDAHFAKFSNREETTEL